MQFRLKKKKQMNHLLLLPVLVAVPVLLHVRIVRRCCLFLQKFLIWLCYHKVILNEKQES